jgi:hypothetical protein
MILALLLLAAPPPDQAAVIPYRGYLEKNGSPINGTKNLGFAIYADAAMTNQLWNDNFLAWTVTAGRFAVSLGSQKPLTAGLFDRGPLYLAITVDGLPLNGVQQILPVAFSQRSSGANHSAGDFNVNGALAVTGAETVSGAVTAASNVSVGGALNTSGNATVNGKLSVKGGMFSPGPLGAANITFVTSCPAGAFYTETSAPTDEIVVARGVAAGGAGSFDITMNVSGALYVLGAFTVSQANANYTQSTSVPIPKGTNWEMDCGIDSGSPQFSYYILKLAP